MIDAVYERRDLRRLLLICRPYGTGFDKKSCRFGGSFFALRPKKVNFDDYQIKNQLPNPQRKPSRHEFVELDVSSFPDGVFILQVKQLSNLYHTKLVVRH